MRKLLPLVILAIALAVPLSADPPKPALVIAHVPSDVPGEPPIYSTSVLAEALPNLDEPETLSYSACSVGPHYAKIEVVPGGANVLRIDGEAACLWPFTLFAAPTPARGVKAQTIIRYRKGLERASYTLPPIGAIEGEEVIRIGPLVKDAQEGSWITVFTQEDDTPVYITLHDARGELDPVTESFTAQPPVAQYPIEAEGVWWAEIQLGNGIPAPYGCWPRDCAEFGHVYGLGTSGDFEGGSVRAYPFPTVEP